MELIILKPGTDYPPTVPPKCPPTHPYALIPSRCGVCSHPQGVVCTHTLKVWCVLIPSRCGVCSYPQGVVCCPVSLQSLLPPPLDSQIPCDFHAAKGLWQRVQLHVRQKPGQRSGLLRHSAHGPCVRPSPDGPVRTAKGLGEDAKAHQWRRFPCSSNRAPPVRLSLDVAGFAWQGLV